MDEFLEGKDLYVEEIKNIASEPSEIKATVREISTKTPVRKISSQEDIRESNNVFDYNYFTTYADIFWPYSIKNICRYFWLIQHVQYILP